MGVCSTGEIAHMETLPDELQTEIFHAAEATQTSNTHKAMEK